MDELLASEAWNSRKIRRHGLTHPSAHWVPGGAVMNGVLAKQTPGRRGQRRQRRESGEKEARRGFWGPDRH